MQAVWILRKYHRRTVAAGAGDIAFTARVERCNVGRVRVERRLVSDVPLGIFLSGGIDSGLIAAAARQVRPPDSIKAFTIGFVEKSFDESEYAKAVANHLGIDHELRVLHIESAKNNGPVQP